jgi:hypothetical protein
MADAGRHALYLRKVMEFIRMPPGGPTPLFCDNSTAVWFASREEFPFRMKHLFVQVCAIRGWTAAGKLWVINIAGEDNTSDIMTKQKTSNLRLAWCVSRRISLVSRWQPVSGRLTNCYRRRMDMKSRRSPSAGSMACVSRRMAFRCRLLFGSRATRSRRTVRISTPAASR